MPAQIEDNIASLLDFGHRYMTHALSKGFIDQGYDITADQFLLLKNLWRHEGISQQLLACFTQKNKVSIVKLLDRLEARGLVERRNSPTDRRSKLIYLTTRGRELEERLTVIAQSNLDLAIANISPEKLAECKATIRDILDNLIRMNCEPVSHLTN